jgi:toxin CcdB
MPLVEFEDETYVLMTHHLAGIARAALGAPAGSLVRQRDTIIAALDFLFIGF